MCISRYDLIIIIIIIILLIIIIIVIIFLDFFTVSVFFLAYATRQKV